MELLLFLLFLFFFGLSKLHLEFMHLCSSCLLLELLCKFSLWISEQLPIELVIELHQLIKRRLDSYKHVFDAHNACLLRGCSRLSSINFLHSFRFLLLGGLLSADSCIRMVLLCQLEVLLLDGLDVDGLRDLRGWYL